MSDTSDNIPLRALDETRMTCPPAGPFVARAGDKTPAQGESETAQSCIANKMESQDISTDQIVLHAANDAASINPSPDDNADKAPSDDYIEGHPIFESDSEKCTDTSTDDAPLHALDTNPQLNRRTLSANVLDPKDKALAEYVSECVLKGIRDIRAEGLNGWTDISKTVNEIDDEKLENCKDDMDTLLVFAGLFSAVLTAFIIESYQNLSPDTADMTVQLLNRIAVQTSSYTITPSFMNATATTPPFEPFEPLPVTLRVNRLWFASLILSLITASFGILIKQWLREYKAVDFKFSNLRTRLRIRQFRYPGLLKWKVFEIADVLPLLMQLALGLFLLGLCLFTWSVNTSIGRYSTALVAAWIFFFIAAAFAPAVSSNCPYKISLLSPILPTLRSWMSRVWTLRWTYVGPHVDVDGPQPQMPDEIIFWSVVLVIIHIPGLIFGLLTVCMPSPLSDVVKFLCSPLDVVASHAFNKLEASDSNPRTIPLEEGEVAKNEDKDLEVLSTVDNAILDDEHLTVTMRSIIAQNQFAPEEIVNFACQALQRRLPQLDAFGTEPVFSVSDLRSLPPRSLQMLVDTVFDALHRHCVSLGEVHSQQDPGIPVRLLESPQWICNAVAIFASRIDESRVTVRDPSPLLSRYRVRLHRVSPRLFENMPFKDIWADLRRRLSPIIVEDPMSVLQILRSQHCNGDDTHDSLGDICSHLKEPQDISVIIDITLVVIRQASLHEEYPTQPLTQLLIGVMSRLPIHARDDPRHIPAFFSRLFEITRNAPGEFSRCLLNLTPSQCRQMPFKWLFSEWAKSKAYRVLFRNACTSDRATILHVFIFALHCYYLDTEVDHSGSMSYVFDFCHEAVKMYGMYNTHANGWDCIGHEKEWTVILYLLDHLIRRCLGGSNSYYKEERSQAATRILRDHWSSSSHSFSALRGHAESLHSCHWNRILESLHMWHCLLRPSDEYHQNHGCDCPPGHVKFSQTTLEHMKNNGWLSDPDHAAADDDASGEHVVTPMSPQEERKVKKYMAFVLGIESAASGESAPVTTAEDMSNPISRPGDPAAAVET